MSRVIVDPSSCCVTPMTTNNRSVVVRRLVATSLWATWQLGCMCDYGNGREGIAQLTCIVDAGDGSSSPCVMVAVSALPTSRASDVECAFVLGRQGAASSLCWRSSPSVRRVAVLAVVGGGRRHRWKVVMVDHCCRVLASCGPLACDIKHWWWCCRHG